MYQRLFRSAILPTLDRLNGTSISAIVRLLEQSEQWPFDRLLELQRAKFERLRSWTSAHSAFYREHWRSAGAERRAASVYPELDGLPIVDKNDLRPAAGEFPLRAYRGRVRVARTSGSTGAPMAFIRTLDQESWFWAIRFRMWRWAGYEAGEPYLAINLNARTALKKRLQDVFFRCTYLTYTVANQDSRRILEILQSRRITHINGFSSSIAALAAYMQEHGVSGVGRVRGISATGDNLFPARRELIERVFGVGVTDYYGAGGEGVHLASQCEQRDQYHLHMENAIVELIADGRPARPGEVGHVVVTQLDNYAMPLIRYDLGDIATAAGAASCACGRALPLIRSIDGRACDVVRVPDGTELLPQFFFIGAFKLLERVERYQIVQQELDRVAVRLIAKPGCDRRQCEAELRKQIATASNGLLRTEFEWVDAIPLPGRGKFRAVVSAIEPQPVPAPMVDGPIPHA